VRAARRLIDDNRVEVTFFGETAFGDGVIHVHAKVIGASNSGALRFHQDGYATIIFASGVQSRIENDPILAADALLDAMNGYPGLVPSEFDEACVVSPKDLAALMAVGLASDFRITVRQGISESGVDTLYVATVKELGTPVEAEIHVHSDLSVTCEIDGEPKVIGDSRPQTVVRHLPISLLQALAR